MKSSPWYVFAAPALRAWLARERARSKQLHVVAVLSQRQARSRMKRICGSALCDPMHFTLNAVFNVL